MPAKPIKPNANVLAARARRTQQAGVKAARMEWYLRNVQDKVSMTMVQRVKLATEYLKSEVVKNIAVPVVRATGVRSRRVVVVERSKPGEYPRADTTMLMKSIFGITEHKPNAMYAAGHVGTTIEYGAILETNEKLDRSFLVRTHSEALQTVQRFLTGPIKSID